MKLELSYKFTRILFTIFLGISINSYAYQGGSGKADTSTFKLGEKLEYKLKYGWFTLGKGTIDVEKKLTTIKEQNAYQVRVNARTAGLASLTANIDDHYYSAISTKNLKPLYSEKHIKNGKSDDWDQWNQFDYDSMKVEVEVKDSRKEDNLNWTVDLEDNTYGLLSTYFYFRDFDWSGYHVGDSILQNIFYEKRLYFFGLEYGGIEHLKMSGEKIKAHKIYLLLEKSGTFPNKRSVAVWITADKNKYPIRIQAKMKFGSVKVDLTSFNETDLKHYNSSLH